MATDGQPGTVILVPPTREIRPPTIPGWVPPLDTGQPSAEELNSLGQLPKQTFAARNTIIPITYGRDRMFGKPFVIHVDEANGFLYVAYGFCVGEIQGFETVFIDSVDINDPTEGFLLSTGSAIELHTGTPSQTVSTLLSGALVGYTDPNANTAYVVIKAPKDSSQGFPKVEAIVQGRKVYDPRLDTTRTDINPVGSGTHRVGDPTTWAFTTTPSLHFRDMVENFSGWSILDQGVVDCANFNEELIGGVKRREVGLTLAKPSLIDKWAKGFRTYMGAFLGWEDGKIRVIPNRADVDVANGAIFDGTVNTDIDMGDQAVLDFNASQDFTVEAWFKASSITSTVVVVGKQDATGVGASIGYSLDVSVGFGLRASITDGVNAANDNIPGVFDDNKWHHIAMIVDRTSSTLEVYADGVGSGSPADISTVGSLATTEQFRIGADEIGSVWNGSIDEVRVWNVARTQTELTDNLLREIATPALETALVGYWKLNESPTDSIAIDSSSSGNNGTLLGNTVFGLGNQQLIPTGVAMHITADDILKDSLVLTRRSLRNSPNSVAVDYEDSSGTKWHTERVQVDGPNVTSGAEQRRLSRISLPGIHNASQAQREATERLNWYLTDLEAKLTLFDPGWRLQNGSIVAVTHPIGLNAKLFRVRKLTALSGRWTVDLVEYDPAIYSNEVIANPSTPDTNLGNPLNVPTVSGLALAEELFNYKSGITGSRVRITWNATGFPFLSQYLVEGYVGGIKVWETFTSATNVATPGVEELVSDTAVDYEVRVYIQSPFATGAAVIDTVSILGKLLPPSDVPSVTALQTAAGSIELSWDAATDIDIWRYEVRRGSTSDTWATATALGLPKTVLIDGLNFQETGLSLGTHRYFVKAIDSVDNESLNESFSDVTLIAPSAVTILNGFEVASEVRLNWPAAVGGFVQRYRVAYSDIPQTFETTLDIVDTLRFQTKDVPEGAFTFKVYSLDALGNEAPVPATTVIEVTSDADAFLADTYEFNQSTTEHANGSLTNMVEWDLRLDDKKYYVTNMADSFAVAPTDFIAAVPLANYHSIGASEWLSETKNFGLLLTGSWNLTQDVVALSGVFDVALELSADDITYTVFGGSAKGEFRYARVRISTNATPGTATAFVKSPTMSLKINVVPLEESGAGVSSPNAGVGATINLAREYTALKEIVAQPKNTIASGSAVTAIVDNIIVGSNTAVKGDGTNYLDGGDIAAFDFGTGIPFSFECWAKHSGQTGLRVLFGKSIVGGVGWSLSQGSNNNFSVHLRAVGVVVYITAPGSFPEDGNWHHIGVAVDVASASRTLSLYVDGVIDGVPRDISGIAATLANAIAFRTHASGDGLNISSGSIDQVRIWNDLRTAQEFLDNKDIALDMTQTQAGLIGYWLMDGPVGSSVTTIQDATINNNDLTNTGAGDLTFIDPGSAGNLIQKINSFDVFIFDIFGQQLAEQFQWKWRAV